MTVRILTIAAIVSVMGLAACGKKGPLEPPKASITTQQ
jgi:predicted small lipoprotein YifL